MRVVRELVNVMMYCRDKGRYGAVACLIKFAIIIVFLTFLALAVPMACSAVGSHKGDRVVFDCGRGVDAGGGEIRRKSPKMPEITPKMPVFAVSKRVCANNIGACMYQDGTIRSDRDSVTGFIKAL